MCCLRAGAERHSLGKPCSEERFSNTVSVSSAKLGCQMGAEAPVLPMFLQGIAPEPVGMENCKYVGHVTLFRTSALVVDVA